MKQSLIRSWPQVVGGRGKLRSHSVAGQRGHRLLGLACQARAALPASPELELDVLELATAGNVAVGLGPVAMALLADEGALADSLLHGKTSCCC